MKKFIKNITLFSIIPLIIMWLSNFFVSPYYGNPHYKTKFDYFNANKEKYNSVILGSSRLYRNINSKLLDSLMFDYKLLTFNLAAPSTFNPEVYFLYYNFLNSIDSAEYKYSLIELHPLNEIDKRNIRTSRNTYWVNFKSLNFLVRYILATPKTTKNKIKDISHYTFNFLYKIIDVAKYKTIFQRNNYNISVLGQQGYYSLNQQMKDIGGVNSFSKRLSNFMNDTSILQKKIEASIIDSNNLKTYVNKTHLDKLNEIIDISKAKGIHVFFVIPPRLPNYEKLYKIKENLPFKNIIDISCARDYPNLYRTEYTFDRGHLNEKGANLFTGYLAVEIKNKLNLSKNNKNK